MRVPILCTNSVRNIYRPESGTRRAQIFKQSARYCRTNHTSLQFLDTKLHETGPLVLDVACGHTDGHVEPLNAFALRTR
jgi:hypothetical protein